MGFFSRRQKRLARNYTVGELKSGYRYSENALREAAQEGDKKALKRAMKVHGNFEYALLYTSTPEYAKRSK